LTLVALPLASKSVVVRLPLPSMLTDCRFSAS
jgi:hypothetical protein